MMHRIFLVQNEHIIPNLYVWVCVLVEINRKLQLDVANKKRNAHSFATK
uniref:Uncharacterized protein n=1 Tax=Rhizophora mucronata TaxID=61149 RepID=A0A2P2QIP7_RHIMU